MLLRKCDTDRVLKVVARIKGGLGNQLFCYAAARRLALVTGAELVLDHVTGFSRDREYQRSFLLDEFNIPARLARRWERLEPFERVRRFVLKRQQRQRPFDSRRYLEQDGVEFDERLLNLRPRGDIYLDGLWQSEGYFRDIEGTLKRELTLRNSESLPHPKVVEAIQGCQSVAVHVRWFNPPYTGRTHNLNPGYYERAMNYVESLVDRPRYFVFSDYPEQVLDNISFPSDRTTIVSQGGTGPATELILMSKCKHFIIANSTFSWWAAWLAESREKLVIAPQVNLQGISAWGFSGLIPSSWRQL